MDWEEGKKERWKVRGEAASTFGARAAPVEFAVFGEMSFCRSRRISFWLKTANGPNWRVG